MSLLRSRLRRIAGTGSPRLVWRAAQREVRARRAGSELDLALRSDRDLVVGPFVGEVGYELLYWRPLVLRMLDEYRVDPQRVTVISRGGAGAWYEDAAARRIDAFELMEPEDVRRRVAVRAERTGQRKQVDVDDLDRELLRRAQPQVGDAAVFHPAHMYWKQRFVWEGLRPVADAATLGRYDELPQGVLPAEVAARLPARFVAVKAYFNDCLPESAETVTAVRELVRRLSSRAPVVLLEAGLAVDDHADSEAGDTGTIRIADLLEPATNLQVQAAVAARADALVTTYGGFAYVGPFTGVRTVAFATLPEPNPLHEAVLRAVRPDAPFERVALGPQANRAAEELPLESAA